MRRRKPKTPQIQKASTIRDDNEPMAMPLTEDHALRLTLPEPLKNPSAGVRFSGDNFVVDNPILILFLSQKAIRAELDRLHRTALDLVSTAGGARDLEELTDRFRFLFAIYKHHCIAEDEVILRALDTRVKNVARAYFLEHHGESELFTELFRLLNLGKKCEGTFHRMVASCIGAIRTSLCQHMSKEEEQVFPLLIEKFSAEEQAALVWQFLCSIPVNTMTEFLPWLTSSISLEEQKDVLKCLCKIIPEEKILQEVVFSWVERKGSNTCMSSHHFPWSKTCFVCGHGRTTCETGNPFKSLNSFQSSKRKFDDLGIKSDAMIKSPPINEILLWHNAIKRELRDLAKETRSIKQSGNLVDLLEFSSRLQFLADVCVFHSIAEDQIIFPAVSKEVSYDYEHAAEESQFNEIKSLIETMKNTGAHSISADIYSELCSHIDQVMYTIMKHFENEESEVLPLARLYLSHREQQQILFQSVCVMPLKLLERVIPWLVASVSIDDARSVLMNMKFAASPFNSALVTLLSGWACQGRYQEIYEPGNFICFLSNELGGCPIEELCSVEGGCSRYDSQNDCYMGSRDILGLSLKEGDKLSSVTKLPCPQIISSVSNFKKPCRVPSLGVDGGQLKSGHLVGMPLHLVPYSSAPIFNSNVFFWEMARSNETSNPIDTIFKFHVALRKDLEYLDTESGKLLDCDENFLQEFIGRFQLLKGLYKAHSNAEDKIVFPALESKETLLNVSHSYLIDHKQEQQLFEDISGVLSSLPCMCKTVRRARYKDVNAHKFNSSSHDMDQSKEYSKLVTKLQGMCKSLRFSLDQHVHREEIELWPLFDKHFSFQEQDILVGRIIGSTGAEILQSMLPWVTSALIPEEQNKMMDTWRQATKNTMFNEWLQEWWEGSPISTSEASSGSSTLSTGVDNTECYDLNDPMFKPGWKEIFRMNQTELEIEIRKVSQDQTLDPRRKAYLIQNLMTSRWIATQQKLPQTLSGVSFDNRGEEECSPSYHDSEKKIYGCEHYRRNCKLVAACCNKLFTCRFCHDKVSDHSMDRKATTEMMCMCCLRVQTIGQVCKTPLCAGFLMARYYCSICKFFDDERMVYHCPFCNLCRVGQGLGIDFFHCMTCNCCLGTQLMEHKCREKGLEANCPICCDFLFTSTAAVRALPCGHFMHSACFQAYTSSHYTCPICSKSLGNMEVYFGMLDALLSAEQLPEEYQNHCQDILCNDCNKKGLSRFHWLYHKCSFCSSYNTRVIKTDTNYPST